MEKITNPTLIRKNLILSSLFVTSFEILKLVIQDRIKAAKCRDFHLNSEGEINYHVSDDYRQEILERSIAGIDRIKDASYHLFYSSCLWLRDCEVIDDNEVEILQKIRRQRNLIAHQPAKILIDDNVNISIGLLKRSHFLLSKIEKWWIMEYEIPSNPDFDGKEINSDEVSSGNMALMDYFMYIASEEVG